jgi:MFS family permease
MIVLDALVVSTALTSIQADLGASIEQLEWTVNAYVLSFAVLLMTAAGLGDRYGRRRVFVIGLGLFAGASMGCALAPDVSWLIAARAIQGAGAALVMPLALALLTRPSRPSSDRRRSGHSPASAVWRSAWAHSSGAQSSRASPGPGSSGSTSLSGSS